MMGRSHSKINVPNNPFEVEEYKRKIFQKRFRECEKETKFRKKIEDQSEIKYQKQLKKQKYRNKQTKTFITENPLELNESDYDIESRNRMQEQLAWDSQSFVLNQIMFALQFYSNFEK